jgi:hypothetical protein
MGERPGIGGSHVSSALMKQISYSMVVKHEQEDAADLPDVEIAFKPSSEVTLDSIGAPLLKSKVNRRPITGKTSSSDSVSRKSRKDSRVKTERQATEVIDLVSDDEDETSAIATKAGNFDEEDEDEVTVIDE